MVDELGQELPDANIIFCDVKAPWISSPQALRWVRPFVHIFLLIMLLKTCLTLWP
jgi:hypothetical protein